MCSKESDMVVVVGKKGQDETPSFLSSLNVKQLLLKLTLLVGCDVGGVGELDEGHCLAYV